MESDIHTPVERFKSKIKEAIELLPQIPEGQRQELWSYWQMVSPAVKSATGGRGSILQKAGLFAGARGSGRGRKPVYRPTPLFLTYEEKKHCIVSLVDHKEHERVQDLQIHDSNLSTPQILNCQIIVPIENNIKTAPRKLPNDSPVKDFVSVASSCSELETISSCDEKPGLGDVGLHQPKVPSEKLKLFVHISDKDRAVADAACEKFFKPSNIENAAAVLKSSTPSVDVHPDIGTTSGGDASMQDSLTPKNLHVRLNKTEPQLCENAAISTPFKISGVKTDSPFSLCPSPDPSSLTNPCEQISQMSKRPRGRPRKAANLLPDKNDAEISASPILQAYTSPVPQSIGSEASEVRRSGRRIVPKKDNIYCYFSLKETSSKSKGDYADDDQLNVDEQLEQSTDKAAHVIPENKKQNLNDHNESPLNADSNVLATSQHLEQERLVHGGILKKEALDISKQRNIYVASPLQSFTNSLKAASVDDYPTVRQVLLIGEMGSEQGQETGQNLASEIKSDTAFSNVSMQTPAGTAQTKSLLACGPDNGKSSWNLRFPLSEVEEEKLRKRTCTFCGIVLLSQSSMAAHMRTHTGEKPWPCSMCKKAFATKANCERHLLTHSGVKAFGCPDCGNRFADKKCLQVHMRTHTGERPYKCSVCSQRFTQPGTLRAHMDRHLEMKRHLCSVCGERFRQSANLRMHILRHHQNLKKFKCGHCEKLFFTNSDLQRHELKHSGLRPFSCDQCHLTFTRKQSLKEHQNTHLDIKPYKCCVCGMCFFDFASCHRHVNKHNKGNMTVAQAKGNITDDTETKEMTEFFNKIERGEGLGDGVALPMETFKEDGKLERNECLSVGEPLPMETLREDCASVTEGHVPSDAVLESDPMTVSGNVVVTIDGGREIHLQISDRITTIELVAHVQNLLREQQIEMSGNQVTDNFGVPKTSLVAGSCTPVAGSAFLAMAPDSLMAATNMQASATDSVLGATPNFLGNVLQIGDGGTYQVTLMDPVPEDASIIMEEGQFISADSVIIPQSLKKNK